MHIDQYTIVFYILFWIVRINGCIRRGRQPLLRGPEWFFNVHVRPDFYQGEGRRLLHRYWLRMLIPFAIDIPIAAAILYSGRIQLLSLLMLALCVVIHLNHSFSVDLAERQAAPFAIAEAVAQVASVTLSLKPRRLRDYTNLWVEVTLGLVSILSFAWLIRYFITAPAHHDFRLVFGVPLLMIYMQLGLLFVKAALVAWRSPVPNVQSTEHIEAREATRRFYLRICDWNRAAAVGMILFWLVAITASPADMSRLFRAWFAVWLVISVVSTVLVEVRRKQLVTLALRARPVKLPDLLHESELARWPVCYQPSAPILLLRGAHGRSLNLANRFARLGAAWLAGLVTLVAVLPLIH